jgi:hypothetical protein
MQQFGLNDLAEVATRNITALTETLNTSLITTYGCECIEQIRSAISGVLSPEEEDFEPSQVDLDRSQRLLDLAVSLLRAAKNPILEAARRETCALEEA